MGLGRSHDHNSTSQAALGHEDESPRKEDGFPGVVWGEILGIYGGLMGFIASQWDFTVI